MKERTSVTLDPDLYKRVQHDESMNLSGLVNRVVREYYEGGHPRGLDLQIRRVENRLEEVRTEEEKLEQRLADLEERKERVDDTLDEALDALEGLSTSKLHPENLAVETQARKLGVRPDELCEEVKQARAD